MLYGLAGIFATLFVLISLMARLSLANVMAQASPSVAKHGGAGEHGQLAEHGPGFGCVGMFTEIELAAWLCCAAPSSHRALFQHVSMPIPGVLQA